MSEQRTFRIGTRKSQLAMVQTELVCSLLQKSYPQHKFEIVAMSTTGDRILDVALSKIGEKSLFTKELEVALEDGRVDFVVHSLKDLPTTLPEGMYLGAVLERENPHDAVVLSDKFKDYTLATLPAGSVIGTSSLRRVAQLKRKYPHLTFTDVRGNLNTRLSKLDDPNGQYAAIVLAVAGLTRLNMTHRISHILSPSESLHAVSQGALGVECRENDPVCTDLLVSLNHPLTRLVCTSERSLMRTLEGGCSVPIGVNSSYGDDHVLKLRGLVASLDGQTVVEHEDQISVDPSLSLESQYKLANDLGVTVANKLLELGADAILKELSHS
ncbi:porphobilinogen deaminase [Halteromyces radiatus]|uniref:porphobilinogen deaminase n=1 Tax=Halteromyces radiatus TaxID=101107 RepID=UPI002220E32F|nr:porphobilinogen deaminase [Halteromyces radiatus]KAI8080012.1 porphobilinogen deaminase [Halteromyces radiatus]